MDTHTARASEDSQKDSDSVDLVEIGIYLCSSKDKNTHTVGI